MPFFSVVIPTYNQCDYLKKALKSVINQRYKNYEIIIIDNNSSDDTRKIVKKFKSKKIIYRKINNKGVIAKSRNLGIRISKGKWIALLDSDDFWYKEKLKIIFNIIKMRRDVDVICNDKMIYYEDRSIKKIYKYGPYKTNFYEYLLRYGNRVSTSASVIRKGFLKGNNVKYNENKKFITTEDYDFFLNIARMSGKFYFCHKVLGGHLIHRKSASSNYSKHRKAFKAVSSYHVFKLQKFCGDKNKLWKDVNYSINFEDLIYIIKGKKINYSVFTKIIKLFFNSPFNFLKLSFTQFYNSFYKTNKI